MTAAILSSHRRVAPYGLAGGESGALGRNSVVRTDGSTEVLLGADRTEMNAGRHLRHRDAGRRRLGVAEG